MIYISCENRPRHLPLFLHEAREKRKYLLNMRSNSFALYALKCEQFLSIQIAINFILIFIYFVLYPAL
jgi:hypothetical protein